MSDEVTVEQKMGAEYAVVTQDVTAAGALEKLTLEGAIYCVVMSPSDGPVALATAQQLEELTDRTSPLSAALGSLPPAVIIEPGRTLDQIVDDFSPLLLAQRSIRGLLVFEGGRVKGVLPRRAVSEHAGFRMRIRGLGAGQIEGDPTSPARVYVCPKGDYETAVVSYDRHSPPRCPNDQYTLIVKR